MKIGLITNWNENCAVAEYARKLALNCVAWSDDVNVKVIPRPMDFDSVWKRASECDIIHLNYCAHVFAEMGEMELYEFRKRGKPVLMTFHESSDWQTRRVAMSGIADEIIVHDRARDGAPFPSNVRVINFGVSEVDVSGIHTSRKIGTFGCAFPWKGLYPLAYTAGRLGLNFMALLSEPDSDTGRGQLEYAKKEILAVCPWAEVVTGWMKEDEVITRLASCSIVAFPFDAAAPITGISSSVRFGISAQRPLVLTRCAHFSDLYDYEEEIYFVGDSLGKTVVQVMVDLHKGRAKVPRRALEEMNWKKAAGKYCEAYRDLAKRTEKKIEATVCS
jgi:hypothetical protein